LADGSFDDVDADSALPCKRCKCGHDHLVSIDLKEVSKRGAGVAALAQVRRRSIAVT
jgi:hypothetical protein